MPVGNKSEAELALQRKYELLRKKKLKQQQEQAAKTAGSKPTAPANVDKPKVDPVRQAAIEALKRKQASSGTKPSDATAATAPAAAPQPSAPVKEEPNKIKLKFVIPKREPLKSEAGGPTTGRAQTGAGPAAKRKAESDTKAPVGTAHQHKRPALRRVAQPKPEPQPTQQAAPADRRPSIPRLFVGDLPEHFTSEALFEFFSRFHDVTEAHVVPGYCYGFITFGKYEEAEAVLGFQEKQAIRLEDRDVRITWAREGSGHSRGGYMGGFSGVDPHTEHPKISQARAAAAQVAEQIDQHELAQYDLNGPPPVRALVTYDDL